MPRKPLASFLLLSRANYTRHTSSCMCVGFVQSPELLTGVNSSGLTRLPPSCNSNYLEYRQLSLAKFVFPNKPST
ncbi:hypothetical protein EFV61_04450 [Yersinia enterocolitica]|nr:hypothetical protein [Yersinia enterocolitica]EKN4925651.1 hypothetical protein [Yersinia enterocolitica]EKN4929892.1 hypothetical protein [Yersinia enterocolitica]EKN5011801.1 hypothetical protein [Yersinia enterocolitica]EKN5024507.1 hypothetical protein [Yersinia enterocolitica]